VFFRILGKISGVETIASGKAFGKRVDYGRFTAATVGGS